MSNFQEWLNEPTHDGRPRHERICFLLEANGGPTVYQWCITSFGNGHQRGLEQNEALELIQVTAFMSGLEAMGVERCNLSMGTPLGARKRFVHRKASPNGRRIGGREMNREDVIRMARETGTPYVNRHFKGQTSYGFTEESLLRFAALVAAADRETVSAVLAKALDALQHYTEVVETINDPNSFAPKVLDIGLHARDAIAAIRALK